MKIFSRSEKPIKPALKWAAACALAFLAIVIAILYWWNELICFLEGPAGLDGLDRFGTILYRSLTFLGGLIAIGLAVWRSRISERQTKSGERRLEHAVKGQYSERFAKAVEQVANKELAVRLGGLASLKALSHEAQEEHIRVWNYLCTFLRYPPSLQPFDGEEGESGGVAPSGKRPDIATVVDMLRERDQKKLDWEKGYPFNLEKANLEWANLTEAYLAGANLRDANLAGADLRDANLAGADLAGAKLMKANLRGANLTDADLPKANLTDVDLPKANLGGANLWDAKLTGAYLAGANLTDANLSKANLAGARMKEADRKRINLTEAQSREIEVIKEP